jgi:monoterpene epsilon-lactone hydrolase
VSLEQREDVDRLLREGSLDLGGELAEQRQAMEQMMAALPLPDDVETSDLELGGVHAVLVETATSRSDRAVLYLHGGAYALGSARAGVGLAAEVARRCGSRAYSVDYRLAPEHPHPAGVEDCVAAYRGLLDSGFEAERIVVVGESAGGGLVAATLVAAKSADLPQPAGAALMSPWADLTLSDPMLKVKAEVDPALSADGLRRRRDEYVEESGAEAASPVFADLTGVAPMLIQAGSHEVLSGDALQLARRAVECDVRVDLQVWPGVPHVFQGFAAALDEGVEALDSLGRFLGERLAFSDAKPSA